MSTEIIASNSMSKGQSSDSLIPEAMGRESWIARRFLGFSVNLIPNLRSLTLGIDPFELGLSLCHENRAIVTVELLSIVNQSPIFYPCTDQFCPYLSIFPYGQIWTEWKHYVHMYISQDMEIWTEIWTLRTYANAFSSSREKSLAQGNARTDKAVPQDFGTPHDALCYM